MAVASPRLNTAAGNHKMNGVSLPVIKVAHPSSRLGDPTTINVRGTSRQDSRCSIGGQIDQHSVNPLRPVTADQLPYNLIKSPHKASLPALDEVRETGIVFSDDKQKPSIPILGNRADINSRIEHRLSPRSSTSGSGFGTGRISTDEVENLLREKMKNGYFMIKNAFKSYDPEGRGTVNRESLNRIISNFLSIPVGLSQFNKLMIRFNLDHKKFVSVDEFYSCFRPKKGQDSEYPTWLDIHRRVPDKMTSVQVFLHLKEKAKQRFLDLASIVPQTNPDGTKRILKPEFRNALHHLGFFMEDDEFEKLWAKFDTENIGVISSEKILHKLGMSMDSVPRPNTRGSRKSNGSVSPRKSPSSPEVTIDRKDLDAEDWLKRKFREGVADLHHAFLEVDVDRKGTVNKSQFKRVLSDYDIKLSDEELNELFERANLPTKGLINYKDFLKLYQDRSTNGMTHKILSDPEHPYHKDNEMDSNRSSVANAEAKLMDLLQKEFLSLLGTFHKLDRENIMVLSPKEFRAVIESKLHLTLKEDEFIKLLDKVPLDENGMIKYAEFMTRFDTRESKSLFDIKSTVADVQHVKDLPDSPPPSPRKNASRSRGSSTNSYDSKEGRTLEELKDLIKNVLKNNFQVLEQEFHELDEFNTKKLTQDMLMKLLKRFSVHLSRNEIKRLWDTLITDQKGALEYTQFIRHFVYSLQSAAFPNSKISPPKRGDSDFQIRSKTLNSAYDMLEDNLRSKVNLNWEKLHEHFKEQDPDDKGFISLEQFKGVLQDLCIHLTDHECFVLCTKFDIKKDGSVNWIEFLKPFASWSQVFRKGNNMRKILTHAEESKLNLLKKPTKSASSIVTRLKNELAVDWKQIRRSFRKLDDTNDGLISVQDFRTVMRNFGVTLSSEELYQLLSELDENLEGRISYRDFLSKIRNV